MTPTKPALFLRPVDHRHGDARDADELVALVGDADFPNMAAAADMDRARGADHPAAGDAAHMVGVDLLADAVIFLAVDAVDRAQAAERFGQRHRGAAVEQPGRLAGAVIDRHAGLEIIVAGLDQLDAEMLDHRALAALLDEVLVEITEP